MKEEMQTFRGHKKEASSGICKSIHTIVLIENERKFYEIYELKLKDSSEALSVVVY